MKNAWYLEKSIWLLNLKKNIVSKAIMSSLGFFLGAISCKTSEWFVLFTLIVLILMYFLINAMINSATENLKNEEVKK